MVPSLKQIKHHAQAALNSFETLDGETQRYACQGHLRSLLGYIALLQSAKYLVIRGISRVEGRVRFEFGPPFENDISDLSQLELLETVPGDEPCDQGHARDIAEKNVRL
jgi:hypothetical protein